jgi:hypothetical protein
VYGFDGGLNKRIEDSVSSDGSTLTLEYKICPMTGTHTRAQLIDKINSIPNHSVVNVADVDPSQPNGYFYMTVIVKGDFKDDANYVAPPTEEELRLAGELNNLETILSQNGNQYSMGTYYKEGNLLVVELTVFNTPSKGSIVDKLNSQPKFYVRSATTEENGDLRLVVEVSGVYFN